MNAVNDQITCRLKVALLTV